MAPGGAWNPHGLGARSQPAPSRCSAGEASDAAALTESVAGRRKGPRDAWRRRCTCLSSAGGRARPATSTEHIQFSCRGGAVRGDGDDRVRTFCTDLTMSGCAARLMNAGAVLACIFALQPAGGRCAATAIQYRMRMRMTTTAK